MRPAVEVVWFDMDDTLFDHAYATRAGLTGAWRSDRRLRSLPLHEVVRRYAVLLDEISPSASARPMSHAEARRERFRRLYESAGTRVSEREASAISRRYRAIYQRARRPVPGVPALLRGLPPDLRIGIVTNNHTAEQEDKLRAIGLRGAIRYLVTSEDVGASKPDPAIFSAALEYAGVSAERSVMVGDRWGTDVLGAVAAGIRPVWFNRWGEAPPTGAPPVAELRSFRPLSTARPTILEGRSAEKRSSGPPL
jgi:HAD superfamily hydrolase (TIGR01509 family)